MALSNNYKDFVCPNGNCKRCKIERDCATRTAIYGLTETLDLITHNFESHREDLLAADSLDISIFMCYMQRAIQAIDINYTFTYLVLNNVEPEVLRIAIDKASEEMKKRGYTYEDFRSRYWREKVDGEE